MHGCVLPNEIANVERPSNAITTKNVHLKDVYLYY